MKRFAKVSSILPGLLLILLVLYYLTIRLQNRGDSSIPHKLGGVGLKLFKKKIGLGSISLLLFIMGIVFIYSPDGNTPGLGDNILYSIGLYPMEPVDGGIRLTPFYSFIFFVPSFIFGHKFKNNFGAALGKILSLIIIIILLILGVGSILHKMHLI